jgi:F420-dependent oxidoreductase-like protein
MKFGIQHPNYTYDGEGKEIVDTLHSICGGAEELGFDSFWVMDHLHQISYVGRPEEPMLEGWTTISTLAGMTSKIKLGTLVTGNAYRFPTLLAKIGATLDILSKGRLFLGIGAAWNAEEAEAYGIPFPSTGERLQRLQEAVQIIKKMWSEKGPVNFEGKFYKAHNAYCNPMPIQKPHPKILIGGVGEKILLRIVAKYGDACNLFGSPETVKKKLSVLRQHCKEVGRDYGSILKTKLTRILISEDEEKVERRVKEMSKATPEEMLREAIIYGTPEEISKRVEEFRDAGVEYLIMSFEAKEELKAIMLFGKEVLPRF